MPTAQLYSIYPGLFIRGHTLGIDSEKMLRLLVQHRIQLVLNVSLRDDPYLSSACRTIGIRYQFTPMHDSQDVDRELVDRLSAHVLQYLQNQRCVLIHCDSGRNRSALIALTAMVKNSPTTTPAELLTEARKVRPTLLTNSTFESFILNLR